MKLNVIMNGREAMLDIERNGDRYDFRVAWDGHAPEPRQASLVQVEPGIYSVMLDGVSYEVKINPGVEGWLIDVQGEHIALEVQDPRARSRKRHGYGAEGRHLIKAPMPGKVIRLLAKPGDVVEAGQGLVVVEAMKMQNEMKSPRTGKVVEMNAREGATVNPGDTLVVVE